MASFTPCFTLYLRIEDNALFEQYNQAAQIHNEAQQNDPCANAGFDLFCRRQDVVQAGTPETCHMIDLGLRAFMRDAQGQYRSFFMYPRSSLSKTPLMLANHTGIIDSGYRGVIMAAVRNLHATQPYVIEKDARLFQLCTPNLDRFLVQFVTQEEFHRVSNTSRGAGGFGSTGV